jgi:hypothetical protein
MKCLSLRPREKYREEDRLFTLKYMGEIGSLDTESGSGTLVKGLQRDSFNQLGIGPKHNQIEI